MSSGLSTGWQEGIATNTYTTPGITSAAIKAAQTGPIQLVTSDAGGDLATASLSSLGLASSADISALNASINNVASRAHSGVAMAFAHGRRADGPAGREVCYDHELRHFRGRQRPFL